MVRFLSDVLQTKVTSDPNFSPSTYIPTYNGDESECDNCSK